MTNSTDHKRRLVALSLFRLHYLSQWTHSSNPGLALSPILIIQQVYICWAILSATIPNLKAFVRSFGTGGFGIGVDMETYANSKYSAGRNGGYELRSGRSRQTTASKYDNRSYNEVKDQGRIPLSQRAGMTSNIEAGSIASDGSQRHIIKKDVQWDIHYEDGWEGIQSHAI